MKKLLSILCALLVPLFLLSAEEPRRIAELGVNAEGGVSNNLIGLGDLFQETLVINLNETADKLGGMGLTAAGEVTVQTWFNLKLGKNLRLGVFLNNSERVYGNIDQSFFDLLAEGNQVGSTTSSTVDLRGDAYIEAGVDIFLRLGKLNLSIRPAGFVPLAYVANPNASLSLTTENDGTIRVNGSADIPFYSAVPVDQLEAISTGNPGELAAALFNQGGVDMRLNADYELTEEWVLGVFMEGIPLAPATLPYLSLVTADFVFVTDNLLEDLANESFDMPTYDYTLSNSSTEPLSVFRPFRFGLTAEYQPWGFKPLTVRPNLAMVLYDSDTLYFDGGVDARLNLANILIVDLGMNYQDQIWEQSLGLIFNIRVLELDFKATTQSADFLGSFTAQGLKVSVGVRVGF